MAAPNLLTATNVTAKSTGANVTTVTANVVNNAAASNTLVKVNYLNITNSSASTVTSNIFLSKSGGSTYTVMSNISIPSSSVVVGWGRDAPVFLEEGDAITANVSANSAVVITASYEIIS